jgi:hypothetical protein
VDRELRVASRRRGTYWSRALVAVLVIGIGLWLYLIERRAPPAQLSLTLFIALTIVVGLFALFSGVRRQRTASPRRSATARWACCS